MRQEHELTAHVARIIQASPENVSIFFKGRVALFATLKAIGIGSGDEVLMPAYTCVVVPNAVKYLGATPRYVDIDLSTFSARPAALLGAIGPRTKAVICQNTYGLSWGVDEVASRCRDLGVMTIEDCTHGFGGFYHGKPNGSWCDAAFYSSQWNKPFSTGLGGYAVTANVDLARKIATFAAALPGPSLKTRAMLWGLLKTRRFVTPQTYYALVTAYRYLSKRNLVTGSSSGEELDGTKMPDDYLLSMSRVQIRAGIKALKRVPELNALRKRNGVTYTDFLKSSGFNHVEPALHDDHLFLKYPLLVSDRKEFKDRAKKAGVPLGDWFLSPLHPIETDLSPWDFDIARYPRAAFAAVHVVNLPTDSQSIDPIISFLRKNGDLILPNDVKKEGNHA